jgi:mono/diheme cytochrome c family protein
LIGHLNHPNGWWRDNAQKEIIVRNDRNLIAALRFMAAGKDFQGKVPGQLARIHALWTLEGLEAIDKATLYTVMQDPDPQLRKMAIWIGEIFIRMNDQEFISRLNDLKKDTSADVLVQLSLSLRSNPSPKAQSIVKELLASNPGNELIQYSYSVFTESQKNLEAERKRTSNLSPEERDLVTRGATIFHQLCATCHGPDGRGVLIGGKAMPAPPLAGSPRVRGDKIMNVQILLDGLKGPIDGKNYPDMMPSQAKNDDQWIASVLSYIRNSGDLGNNASVVTPAEVKYVRDSVPRVQGGITIQTLEIFKLGRSEKKQMGR